MLGLLHRDLHALSGELVAMLHLNPGNRYPHIFIDLLSQLNDERLWLLAGLALLYAIIRCVEAYGLWRQRTWAEWLALVGACIYLPFEVYELWTEKSLMPLGALVFNVLIVLLMGRVLWQKRQSLQM
ncbi:MAG: DUF2127 domain-containing protein [Prosthecobacter sp.]|nr:DUF2127 domain-containing protein [Prosthecobacter sp.]